MKVKGVVLIVVGVLAGAFVLMFDIIAGKPVNDISGPRSIIALAICALLILAGTMVLTNKCPCCCKQK